MKAKSIQIKKITLASILSALGVIIAPFFWFPFLTTKAYPAQHMINALTGVLLGPLWAAAVAIFVGIIRITLGIGTIYAFPGGIPGGIVVGIVYWLIKKMKKNGKILLSSALFEPIGTVLIGATIALYLVAPFIGDIKLLSNLGKGHLIALLILWSGWALSSILGSIFGFIILLVLDKMSINRETLFGEK